MTRARYIWGAICLTAPTMLASMAYALDMTAGWPDATADRNVPYLDRFIGECPYPADMPYPRKGPPNCPKSVWTSYLDSRGLKELQAPPGGRAYRALSDDGQGTSWWQLAVAPNGSGKLTASNGVERSIAANEIAAFENRLSKSEFGVLIPDDDDHGLDACSDALLEAVVDGRYHFVRRGCGFPEDIYAAVRIVDHAAGMKPSDDHCFFLPANCLVPPPAVAKP